jgi:hypothetical protein
MNRNEAEFNVEKMSLPELSALEAGVVQPVSAARHKDAAIETEKRSRDVKREIGAH